MRCLSSRALIVVFIVQLNKNNSVYCKNESSALVKFLRDSNKSPGLVCSSTYRTNYISNNQKTRDSNWVVESDSEFMLIDDSDADGSSEFIIHERTGSNVFLKLKSLSRQKYYNISDDNDARMKSVKTETKKKWRKLGKWEKPSWKLRKKDKYRLKPFYTMIDTFGPIFNARRVDNNQVAVSTLNHIASIGWANTACSSMRRVVGGWSPQSEQQFPYMVFVDSGCGGAIIGNNWVLSAAHCVDNMVPKYVHGGSLNLLEGCQFNVARVYIHPGYSRNNLRYDLSLLRIKPSFVYSAAIKPIKLSRYPAHWGMCGVVTGWGAKKYKGALSTRLLMTFIPIVTRRKCSIFRIRSGQFCAGYENGQMDSCQGDSGGPFVVGNYLVGVISFGYQCALPRFPGVYVDVYYHRRWIYRVSGIS